MGKDAVNIGQNYFHNVDLSVAIFRSIFPSNYENNLDRNIDSWERPKFSRHYEVIVTWYLKWLIMFESYKMSHEIPWNHFFNFLNPWANLSNRSVFSKFSMLCSCFCHLFQSFIQKLFYEVTSLLKLRSLIIHYFDLSSVHLSRQFSKQLSTRFNGRFLQIVYNIWKPTK